MSLSSDGEELWSAQFGGHSSEYPMDAAVDPTSGNLVVIGRTWSSLGGPNAGDSDVFVRTYDPNGTHLWTRQFGSTQRDTVRGGSVNPAGTILVAGGTGEYATQDSFVTALAANGQVFWTSVVSSPLRNIANQAIGRGDTIYVVGSTQVELWGPHLGGADAYIAALSIDTASLVGSLIEEVEALGLWGPIGNSLTVKLNNALRLLSDTNEADDIGAVGILEAFCAEVRAVAGRDILEPDAESLITWAQHIIDVLRT